MLGGEFRSDLGRGEQEVEMTSSQDLHFSNVLTKRSFWSKSQTENAASDRDANEDESGDGSQADQRHSSENSGTVSEVQNSRMRFAFGVLVRLLLPLMNSMAKGWQGLRGFRFLKNIRNIRANRSLLTNLFAYAANSVSMSLSSVQVVHRIDPWLKKIKFRRNPSVPAVMNGSPNSSMPRPGSYNRLLPMPMFDEAPEMSVTLNVLYAPPKDIPIRADVILIHGLHGSLVNTWKQGMWNSEGRRVKFERPPRPPVRPPKRPRHSRRLDAPHHMKRPRRNSQNLHGSSEVLNKEAEFDNLLLGSSREGQSVRYRDVTYYCDEPETTETIDGLEFSFPTFRSMTSEDLSMDWDDEAPRSSEKRQKFVKTEDYSPCWPRDWLPEKFPDLRVIALNYTTDPYLWRPVWIKKRNRTSLAERTREMTDMLVEQNVGANHPIIWVGHSKGGIFIKKIIVDAWESGRPAYTNIWRSSRGTFFYSVPHRGSPLADFNLPLLRQSVELLEIQKNCPAILELHRRFVALYHKGHLKIKVFSFVETALTLMSVLYLRIVGVDSAVSMILGITLAYSTFTRTVDMGNIWTFLYWLSFCIPKFTLLLFNMQLVSCIFYVVSRIRLLRTAAVNFLTSNSDVMVAFMGDNYEGTAKVTPLNSKRIYNTKESQLKYCNDLMDVVLKLQNITDLLNKYFGKQLVLNLLSGFICITVQMHYMIRHVRFSFSSNGAEILVTISLTLIGMHVLEYFIIFGSGDKAKSVWNFLVSELHRLRILSNEEEIKSKLGDIINCMCYKRVEFHGCHLFTIDLSAITGIISSIATYLIVFVQFQINEEQSKDSDGLFVDEKTFSAV